MSREQQQHPQQQKQQQASSLGISIATAGAASRPQGVGLVRDSLVAAGRPGRGLRRRLRRTAEESFGGTFDKR